jgi:WD40 repeat protein/tRNA A-37 threonylcarbamoyl transferase component Bud32
METRPDTHPSSTVLEAFGLGKLDDALAETVLDHLETCSDCRKEVAAQSGDSFLDRLRQAHRPSNTPAPGASLSDLARRLKAAASAPTGPYLSSSVAPELASHPQYEILRELGRGGMGVVYLARNRLMARLEVLKVVNKEMLDRSGGKERFLREIQSAAMLNHPNVVAAYSALPVGDLLVFAMEYIEGQDLAKLVKERGPLPVLNACYYVQQAALGLQHAFEKKMVHRDIKPQNLILARKGKRHFIKVLDFGLAKVVREQGEDTGLTGPGRMLGTPDYVAPEQTLDATRADTRADIYSLGCTLYFLLTGHAPFRGKSLYDILHAHQTAEATPLNQERAEVNLELAAVVAKMMAKDPAKRYQKPIEVAQALAPFVKPGGKSAADALWRKGIAAPPVRSPNLGGTPEAGGEILAREEVRSAAKATLMGGDTSKLNVPAVDASQLSARKKAAARTQRGWSGQKRPPLPWLVGMAGGLLAVVIAGIVLFWPTPRGVVKIESDDPDVEIVFDKTGPTVKGAGKEPITLGAGEHGVLIKRGEFEFEADKFVLKKGATITLKLKLLPGKIQLLLDGEVIGSRDIPPPPMFPDKPPRGAATGDQAQAQSVPSDGFVPLFNGKDLTGWKTDAKQLGNWRVSNGILIGSGPSGSHLYTERDDFKDFHLRLEMRINGGGSSGAWLRVPYHPTRPPDDPKWYGALVDFNHGLPIEPNQWFMLETIVRGDSYTFRINSKTTYSGVVDDKLQLRAGHVALFQHDANTVCQFRKLEIKLLDATAIRVLQGHAGRVVHVAFSPDGAHLLSGGNSHFSAPDQVKKVNVNYPGTDNTVRLWEVETGRQVAVLGGHTWEVMGLAFCPKDSQLAAACSSTEWATDYADPRVVVYNLKTGEISHRFSLPPRPAMRGIALSADGEQVIVCRGNRTLEAWDLVTNTKQPTVTLDVAGGENALWCVAFTADRRRVLGGFGGGAVCLFDASTGKVIHNYLGHARRIHTVAWSPDEKRIASTSDDGTVRVWDVESTKELLCLTGHAGSRRAKDEAATGVAFCPGGLRILSGGSDGTVRLWDAITGIQLQCFKGHAGCVHDLAISADGRLAASASDESIRLWRLP